jgi:hypothetical protein
LQNRHPFLRRLSWNPLIVAVPLVYLGYTAYRGGFPAGRTAGAGFVALWFGLSVFDALSRHRLLDWLYSDEISVRGAGRAGGPLDWTKLPTGLRYLAEPATKYGELQFENRIMDFLEREATVADREALRALKPLVIRDEGAIDAWIDELGITEHREAALVYFLLHLMALGNDAGLL